MSTTLNLHKHVLSLLKQGQTLSTPVDALSLSCAWYELRQAGVPTNITSLESSELLQYYKPVHSEQAKAIRDYYGKKIILANLYRGQLTSYRTALAEVLLSDGLKIDSQFYGIIYRLPEFYDHDTVLDNLWQNTFTDQIDEAYAGNKNHNLTPVIRIESIKRHTKNIHYYFEISGTKQAAVVAINKNPAFGPLLHMWDQIFGSNTSININGQYTSRIRGEYKHFVIKNWRLDNPIGLIAKSS